VRGIKGGGGRWQLSCKVREYVNTHTETVTMVMLASYESSHRCAGVSGYVYCRIGIHLEGREFKFDDADPGFLQTSGFSTGFANGHYDSVPHFTHI